MMDKGNVIRTLETRVRRADSTALELAHERAAAAIDRCAAPTEECSGLKTALLEAQRQVIELAGVKARCDALEREKIAAEKRIAELESRPAPKDTSADIAAIAAQLTSEQIAHAETRVRLAAQEEAMTRQERMMITMIAGFKDALPKPEPEGIEVEASIKGWDFKIQRDGANNMLGVVATPRDD